MQLSEFFRERYPYPELPNNYHDSAVFFEESYFKSWIKNYPEERHDDIRECLKYLRQYVLKYPDFDGEDWGPSWAAFEYYESRDYIMEHCKISEKDFYNLDILQDAIEDLGLEAAPTFEFIIYSWHILKRWLHGGRYVSVSKKIDKFFDLLESTKEEKIELEVTVGKKHIRFKNAAFIKSLFAIYLSSNVDLACECVAPQKLEIDYILIKTLLTNLPIKYSKEKKGKYTQAERNFGLGVLWLTGEIIHGKSDKPYSSETFNNGTFDKIMRKYEGVRLPALFSLV